MKIYDYNIYVALHLPHGGQRACRPHVGVVHGLWLLNECRMRFIYVTRRLAIAFHGLRALHSQVASGELQVASEKQGQLTALVITFSFFFSSAHAAIEATRSES